jgi:rhodanese-related sulfurtransferase
MTRTLSDLLRQARTAVPEVGPADAERLVAGGARLIDVRERSEWDEGHIVGATHVSRSYLEQQIDAAVPDHAAPVVLYCAGGTRSLFAGQTLQEMGYTDVVSMSGGFQGWKSSGRSWTTPVVLSREQQQRYSRHLLIPEVGAEGQAKLLGSKALFIGACSSVPGAWVPRACSTLPPQG